MAKHQYQARLLARFIVSSVILVTLLFVWLSQPMLTLIAVPALALGYWIGTTAWKRTRESIDEHNMLVVYFHDSITYVLLTGLFLFSFAPKAGLQVTRFFSEHTSIFTGLIFVVVSTIVGYHWVFYRSVRRYEASNGPIILKELYARSVVGVESMIGRHGTTTQNCNPKGKMKIDGTIWIAESFDGKTIESGKAVVVKNIEGLTVFVETVD